MQIASVGIDLGKTTFHLVALEKDETVGSARTLSHNHADEISTAFLTGELRSHGLANWLWRAGDWRR